MKQIETPPILITGAARSGTSLVAGILNICGAQGGKLLGASKYNAKGFFENGVIRDKIEKGYLSTHNLDPLGQRPLADPDKLMIPNNWKSQVEAVLLKQGYKNGPWFYKGAKACHIWPVWHYAFPNAKWVIVRRRTADIAESCLSTAFMHRYSTYDEWVKWVNYHEDRFVEMIKTGLNVKQVWPDRMVRGDYSQILETVEWCGLTWKAQEVQAFIEPKLWKAKQKLGIKIA